MAVASGRTSTLGANQRGCMVLYRLATDDDRRARLLPPNPSNDNGLSSDSKYPGGGATLNWGLVPYAYDPEFDEKAPPDDEDMLHDPLDTHQVYATFAWRGLINAGVLLALIVGLLCVFVLYPVLSFIRNNARNLVIDGNIRINATGQAPVL